MPLEPAKPSLLSTLVRRRQHSDTDIQNYRLRGPWNIDDDRDLSFDIQHYKAEMGMPGALSVKDYRDNPRQSTRPLDL